jgi:hypothetical protein
MDSKQDNLLKLLQFLVRESDKYDSQKAFKNALARKTI